MRSLSCWAVLTSSNAGLTSSGGRALGRLSSVTNRPVREASSEACSIFRADTASASRAPSTVSRFERLTCSRTVDSAACCSISSASRVPNRYFCASPTLYRSEEHTSELQSLMRISYAVFCLKQKNKTNHQQQQLRDLH